jgi:hypothetical protein
MPTEAQYQAEIGGYDQVALRQLRREIEDGQSSPLRSLPGQFWEAGKAMEYLVLRAFESEGARVRYPFSVQNRLTGERTTLEQIDGVVYSEGLACLVEAKDWSSPVDFDEISRLQSNLQRRPSGAIGLFFTHSGYTEPAQVLTRIRMQPTVLLWEWDELSESLEAGRIREALHLKYRYAVEEGEPLYSVLGIL